MAKNGITVYLPRDLEAKVEKIAREQYRSTSSVITEAVRRTHGGHSSDYTPETIAQRYSSRLDARLEKVIGEQLVFKELLLWFVRVWLEHNPPLDEAIEDSAAASAEARFERFLDLVAQALQPGRSLANGELHPSIIYADTPASEDAEPERVSS
jgi:Arc/MetJ-type ribon-helix-helix transcriptional regulator